MSAAIRAVAHALTRRRFPWWNRIGRRRYSDFGSRLSRISTALSGGRPSYTTR